MHSVTKWCLVILVCLGVLSLMGCRAGVIRTKNPPPEGVWEMVEGAYVINYSDPGEKDPFLSLRFESALTPTVKRLVETGKKRIGGRSIYAHLPASTRLRITEVYWKETSLFSGFWVTAEVLTGEDAGTMLTLPDLFKVVSAEEGDPQSFKFKKSYYAVEPAGDFVRLVDGE